MSASVLNGKRILAVDDEPDILDILVEEITDAAPECKVETARTYEAAAEMLSAGGFDLVILDIMGVQGFDLLKKAVDHDIPALMLTAHALTPAALKQSIESGARAYLPKDKLADIVGYLEDVLTYDYVPGWGRLFEDLRGFFNERWGERWKETDERFWRKFDAQAARKP